MENTFGLILSLLHCLFCFLRATQRVEEGNENPVSLVLLPSKFFCLSETGSDFFSALKLLWFLPISILYSRYLYPVWFLKTLLKSMSQLTVSSLYIYSTKQQAVPTLYIYKDSLWNLWMQGVIPAFNIILWFSKKSTEGKVNNRNEFILPFSATYVSGLTSEGQNLIHMLAFL